MAHWLLKSEPHKYSIDDMKRDKTTDWDGVRNYQARNLMKDMEKGEEAFFYHSTRTLLSSIRRALTLTQSQTLKTHAGFVRKLSSRKSLRIL